MPERKEDDPMLRITREVGPRPKKLLRLEGSVVAECVGLLLRESFAALRSAGALSLDLAGVHRVDLAGIEVLGRLSRAGVEIRCPAGPVASVLEEEGVRITRDEHGVGGRRPWLPARLPWSDRHYREVTGRRSVQCVPSIHFTHSKREK
jgi:hypothetical protein